MVQYDKKILNTLLDSYENSLLSKGENKVKIHINFPFSKKTIPEYFDVSSLAYEDIHAEMKELERKGYIYIVWKKGNHIVQKILLNDLVVEDIYAYLKRTPKAINEHNTIHILEEMQKYNHTPLCSDFLRYLIHRITKGETVKEYIDLKTPDKTRQLIKAITAIELNQTECYIREFSIKYLKDSKALEGLLPLIGKVFHQFTNQFNDMDIYAILAEYSIYNTPNYVYIKGSSGELCFHHSKIELSSLKQGIGISGDDLISMKMEHLTHIKRIITIENLTTFFRWTEEDSMIIYLGGYHNSSRRKLLQMLYKQLPHAQYLHFGDIDVGGYEIYEDLCKKTNIPFQTYCMDINTLKTYEKYAKTLTINDKKRITAILAKHGNYSYVDVLKYMLEKNIKLEQECVLKENTKG